MLRDENRIMQLRAMPYEEYLQTPEWQEKRAQSLERAGYRCQLCHTEHNLNVHHASYKHLGNEPLTDLVVLCESDHTWFHYRMRNTSRMSQAKSDPGKDPIMATGFKVVDPVIGLQKGQVLLVGSRSEQGAIPFVLNVGHRAMTSKERTVALFSFTMSKERFMQQMIALDTRIAPNHLLDGRLADDEYERASFSIRSLTDASCWISDSVSTVEDIAHQLEEMLIENQAVDLVIIDSLDLIETGRKESVDARTAAVSRALKLLARKFHVAVLVACTLPQVTPKQAEMPLQLYDVRNVEAYADVVLLLSLDPVKERRVLDILIAKNMNGQTENVTLFYANDGTMHINDFEVTPVEENE